MAAVACSNDEIAERGEDWYARVIRAKVEPDNRGRTVAIDVVTGDFEVDDDHLAAVDRLRARRPEAQIYGMLIGYPAFAKIGGSWAAALADGAALCYNPDSTRPQEGMAMTPPMYSNEEIVRKGKEIYERDIRRNVETTGFGKVLVVDVETGEYELDDDHLAATRRALAKRPDAVLFSLRVGYPALGKLGGSWGRATACSRVR